MLRTLRDGATLAIATFTILPVQRRSRLAAPPGRRVAGVAMSLAPAVGAVLGAAIGGLAIGLAQTRAPAILMGAVCVAATALLTRGIHLDGLADTVDALGSYRGRDRALAIMKSPEVGPFGVVAIGLTLLIQAAAIGALAARPWWQALLALAAAYAAGRAAATIACVRGIPPARPDGLGALVAGTVPPGVAVASWILAIGLAVAAGPHTYGLGIGSVAAGLLVSILLIGHCRKRFGGITGDVLGACVEIVATITLVGLCL